MPKRLLFWGASALILLGLAGFGTWLLTLPSAATHAAAPDVPEAEKRATLAALKTRDGTRPMIAVIGLNDATETTDYLMPVGILRRADIAEVKMLATGPGPVQLYPALRVAPDETVAQFDAAHPEGADYVIVPAMSRDDDPVVLAWLRDQAEKGARIIGVCAGAKVVAAAGLLDGKRATTHWYYLSDMLERSPTIQYAANRRIVADGTTITTTGITASIPMMLTLIEAIAGQSKAEAVAAKLGASHWDARHASGAFRLTRSFAVTVLANRATFWNSEELQIPIEHGIDEVSLALAADAWSRTYRSTVKSHARSGKTIVTANDVHVLPDSVGSPAAEQRRIPIFSRA